MKKFKVQRGGFTLIELLVVMAIVAVVMGVGLAALSSTLRSTTKSNTFNQVKQNGDLAMEIMTRSVQSALDVCDAGGNKQLILYLETSKVNCSSPPINTKRIRFQCTEGTSPPAPTPGVNGEITKYDINANETFTSGPITSGVKVKEGSCVFDASDTFPKRVTIDFILKQDSALGNNVDTSVDIPFHTEVTMRNF